MEKDTAGQVDDKARTRLRREWPQQGVSDIFSDMERASDTPSGDDVGKRLRKTFGDQMRHPYITDQGLKASVVGEAKCAVKDSPAAPTTSREAAATSAYVDPEPSCPADSADAGRPSREGRERGVDPTA